MWFFLCYQGRCSGETLAAPGHGFFEAGVEAGEAGVGPPRGIGRGGSRGGGGGGRTPERTTPMVVSPSMGRPT